MRVERNPAGLIVHTRQRSGCRAITLMSGVLFGVLIALLAWLGGILGVLSSQQVSHDLGDAYKAFDRGDLDDAVNIAQHIWETYPDHTEALILLVRALIYRSYSDYFYEADRQTALNLTTEAMARIQGDADVLAIHAFALHINGEHRLAARLADAALRRNPDHILARMVLGLAYGGIGIHDDALQETQTAVQRGQMLMDTWRALAISYGDLGRYDDALNVVNEAIAQNNHLLALYFERAEYAIHLGDIDAATASYFRILALDPDNVKSRLRLCELSSKLRESETAMRYCLETTQRAPEWAEGWYHLGREYFLQGNFEAAQTSLHSCTTLLIAQNVPISKRRFECWYLQGQAAEILGDCAGLLATYHEFRLMAESENLPQSWTYPPEGPAICTRSSN